MGLNKYKLTIKAIEVHNIELRVLLYEQDDHMRSAERREVGGRGALMIN